MSDRVMLSVILTMLAVGMAMVGVAMYASGWSLLFSVGYPFALAAFALALNLGFRRLMRR